MTKKGTETMVGLFVLSLGLYPFMGLSFFPRTDPGQFVINVKAPSGTRIELTDQYVSRIEKDIRTVMPSSDLAMIVSNIGTAPGFSSIYSSNSGPGMPGCPWHKASLSRSARSRSANSVAITSQVPTWSTQKSDRR